MSDQHRPHLELPREPARRYGKPPQTIPSPKLPKRDAAVHGSVLLEQLDQVLSVPDDVSQRFGASAAVDMPKGLSPDPVQLAKGAAAYVDAGEQSAVLFFPDPSAKTLRGKLGKYVDPADRTSGGAPRHNKLLAPIEQIRRPTLNDLAQPWDLERVVRDGASELWIELWTPGGRLGKAAQRETIEATVRTFVQQYGVDGGEVTRFEAAEHDIHLVNLAVEGIRLLPVELPAVTSVQEPSQARLERLAHQEVGSVIAADAILPPPANAPTIAVLDTGVAEDHPLLEPTLVAPGISVVPGVTSARDAFLPQGHGTGMAGAVAYRSLAADLAGGGPAQSRCEIANIRLWSNDPEALWASRTEEAVFAAESLTGRIAAHLLCLSSGGRPASPRTSWSFAVDRLAYNNGDGRLFCVAAGNVSCESDPQAYPATNQSAEIHDPAQAINALTVGGYTDLDALRPGPERASLMPIARAGELSPHTTTGTRDAPIKPELLMEAGNACPDGTLGNSGLEELSVLTTSVRHAAGRHLESVPGTSIAAAALAGLAGEVATQNPGRRPETIRALLVNSARWPAPLKRQLPQKAERLRCAGYGVPRPQHAVASTPTRATLIHEGRIAPYSPEHTLGKLHPLRLPLPDQELLALGDKAVELSITLSYFAEPHETRKTSYAGASLHWDLQRQSETGDEFLARINARDRDPDVKREDTGSWKWEIGPRARGRGSVQSDRLEVEAAALAGDLLVAVYPAGGWWKDHQKKRAGRELSYAMVITIDVGDADIDLYALIQARLHVDIPVDAA